MNVAENKKILANNIRNYMGIRGVTVQELCSDIGVKYTTFLEWYHARAYPRIGALETLANYFGCEKSDLIEDRNKIRSGGSECSEKKRALMELVKRFPEDKVEMGLRVMRTILESG